ncbi:MAG: DUF924 family protein [Alphaproteobacteria bacterium]|nr:DUF924 family protein [Alphaproteobacteria bacterium]
MSSTIIADIVAFWLGPSLDGPKVAAARRDWWYKGGPAVDDDIRARFGSIVPQACARTLMDWQTTPDGALALILLLDQFTRNLYRNTPDAYRGDICAFEIVNRAIDDELDQELHPVARIWLYHPFHHSEQVEEQDRGLALLQKLHDSAAPEWHAYVQRSITGWTRHRDIVARFGRFPHRNEVLGRENTEEERAFLAADGESFGQGVRIAQAEK